MTNHAVNALLLLAAVNFVTQPFLDTASSVTFTRVGAVYSDSAKVVIRYPQSNATEHKLRIIWRQAHNVPTEKSHPWRGGPILTLTEEQDWVKTTKLSRLWPGTTYECASYSIVVDK
jgi:alkaline phosphatase D